MRFAVLISKSLHLTNYIQTFDSKLDILILLVNLLALIFISIIPLILFLLKLVIKIFILKVILYYTKDKPFFRIIIFFLLLFLGFSNYDYSFLAISYYNGVDWNDTEGQPILLYGDPRPEIIIRFGNKISNAIFLKLIDYNNRDLLRYPSPYLQSYTFADLLSLGRGTFNYGTEYNYDLFFRIAEKRRLDIGTDHIAVYFHDGVIYGSPILFLLFPFFNRRFFTLPLNGF